MYNEKTDEFLDLYRRLETGAERLLGNESRSSAVMRLSHQRGFSAYRDEMDFCREVRNLLSHEPKVDGAYAFYPSEELLAVLRGLVRMVEHPVTVADRMTPTDQLVITDHKALAIPVMEQMRKENVSHIPILSDGRVTGIFSVGTVFQAMLDGAIELNEKTTIGDFAAYLPLERHMGQGFAFVGKTVPLTEAGAIFDGAYSRKHKIKLLLVTATGRSSERLLGVLSPYDLIDENSGAV